jgi:hypothetical protein
MEDELIGDPVAAEHYWEPQTQPLDCEEMAVADIVGQETGHEPTEAEIVTVAERLPSTVDVNPATGEPEPVYDPATGTDLHDAPELLAQYGVPGARYVDDTTPSASGAPQSGMTVLQQDLAAGDKIIAGVDGPTIWDAIGQPYTTDPGHADHAVEVTGIDPVKGIVYLNDSGVPAGGAGEEVPISVFEQAWATSHHAMVIVPPSGTEHGDTTSATLTSDTTPATEHSTASEHATIIDPVPSPSELAERAGLAGTVAAVGATAIALAAKARNRRAGPGSGPSKPTR